jgi:hypothetical protein
MKMFARICYVDFPHIIIFTFKKNMNLERDSVVNSSEYRLLEVGTPTMGIRQDRYQSTVLERNAYLLFTWYKKLSERRRWMQSYGRLFVLSGVENMKLPDPRIVLS